MMQVATGMNPLEAYHVLIQFARQRGEGALRLALHAAVPQSFRPDVLHLLRVNFVPEAVHDPAVEADVLLAPFCEDLGGGYFQFDAEVQRLLLDELVATYANETIPRVQQVAQFLLAYVERRSRTFREQSDRVAKDYWEMQRWVALAFLAPGTAAEQLAAALQQATAPQESVVHVQLGGLVTCLSVPLAQYPQLLTYAAGVQAIADGQAEHGRELLARLPDERIKIGRVILRSPRKVLGESEGKETKTGRVKRRALHKETVSDVGENDELRLHESDQKVSSDPSVFVCYAREDEAFVLALVHQLKSRGVNVWLDKLSIRPGEEWGYAIDKALHECALFLIVLSPRATESREMRGELRAALDANKRIVPILYRPCQIPRQLYAIQCIDFSVSGANDEEKVQHLTEILRASPQPASALLLPPPILSPTFRNSIGMEFVLIPAGEFQMGGSDAGAYNNEKPVHLVRITKPFYLGKYPVTQGQWQAVMGNNPSQFTGDPNRPVERICWADTREFLRRLGEKEGKAYRLPTEAEWEYAARAGATGAYCFGDDESQLKDYAWYEANAGDMTHPVGQLQPNAWGLYDAHGNVGEWCHDGQRMYTGTSVSDPLGPTTAGADRVIRGGNWVWNARGVRSAFRHASHPGDRYGGFGFRCASSV